MFDFIIVGGGLAGVTFANILQQNNKTFCLISNTSQAASLVADGVYNPVVLKRFTPIWRAIEITNAANDFYNTIEQNAKQTFRTQMTVWRKFASLEEQNNWFAAADQPSLSQYLSPYLINEPNTNIPAPYALGEVRHTGRLNVPFYLEYHLKRWAAEGFYHPQTFNYDVLHLSKNLVSYKGVTARNIVFCEGCGIAHNPYFQNLPMRPCKGETLTFQAPQLQLAHILKSDGSIVPLGENLYNIGSTYNRDDLTDTITPEAHQELTEKLEKMIRCPYQILSQQGALRPTVADRRPLIGSHPLYPQVWVLNGLGTRGVLNAPWCAQVLYQAVYEKKEIPPETNINRFQKRLKKYTCPLNI